jgi:hypothetical protein
LYTALLNICGDEQGNIIVLAVVPPVNEQVNIASGFAVKVNVDEEALVNDPLAGPPVNIRFRAFVLLEVLPEPVELVEELVEPEPVEPVVELVPPVPVEPVPLVEELVDPVPVVPVDPPVDGIPS